MPRDEQHYAEKVKRVLATELFINDTLVQRIADAIVAVRDHEFEQALEDFQANDVTNLADAQALAEENELLRLRISFREELHRRARERWLEAERDLSEVMTALAEKEESE